MPVFVQIILWNGRKSDFRRSISTCYMLCIYVHIFGHIFNPRAFSIQWCFIKRVLSWFLTSRTLKGCYYLVGPQPTSQQGQIPSFRPVTSSLLFLLWGYKCHLWKWNIIWTISMQICFCFWIETAFIINVKSQNVTLWFGADLLDQILKICSRNMNIKKLRTINKQKIKQN